MPELAAIEITDRVGSVEKTYRFEFLGVNLRDEAAGGSWFGHWWWHFWKMFGHGSAR